MKEIIFIKPLCVESNETNVSLNNFVEADVSIGTIICFSNQNIILNESYNGLTVGELFEQEKEIFGEIDLEQIPFEISLHDALYDSSVYVTDREHGNKAVHILTAKKSLTALGHLMRSKEEFGEKMQAGVWKKILNYKKAKPGHTYFFEKGIVYGLGRNITYYQIKDRNHQEYVLYDYKRSYDGLEKPLQLKESFEHMVFPGVIEKVKPNDMNDFTSRLIGSDSYVLNKITNYIQQSYYFEYPFLICTVVSGQGMIDETEIKMGDTFIIPSGYEDFVLDGELELMIAHL